MYRLFVIAKNNIKKQKGDMLTFFILTFIAAYLIFDSLAALFGMGGVLDKRFDEVNGAHFRLFSFSSEDERECIEKAVRDHKYMIDFESTHCLDIQSAEHKNGKDTEYGQYRMLVNNMSENPTYMNDLPDGDKYGDNDIVLPLFLKSAYKIGDTMNIKLGDNVYDFNVAGYTSDPYFSSTLNITLYYVFVSDTMFNTLRDENPTLVADYYDNKGVMDESYLSSDYTTMDMEKEVTDSYKELLDSYMEANPEKHYSTDYLCVNWQMMRGGAQFVPLIIMGIVLLFAVIITVISIVIISFSIKNFINRNMKNTGILEAGGYTVRELRGALSFQIVAVSLLGSVMGTIAAILTFDKFGQVLCLALGLEWNQPISVLAAVITIVAPVLVIFLVSRLISRAYKKVTVLDALRGGINTHNYKKNYFAFEKTPLPIPAVVSLKDTVGGLGRTIVMVIIVTIITTAALIGFGMYDNYGSDPQQLLTLLGFEIGTADVGTTEQIADELREIDGVTNVLTYSQLDVNAKGKDKVQSIHTYVFQNIEDTTVLTIVEGRIAKHDNEILLTTAAAEDLNVKCGEVVELEFAGKSAEYLVTGLFQRMDHMGRLVYMTEEGGDKILTGTKGYENMIQTDGMSYDDLKKEIDKIEEKHDTSFNVIDISKQMEGTMGVVCSSMRILCMVISLITVLIVIFVESLVIRAKIVKEWRGMGISKALGMTSGQLIAQIMMSNVPAIIAGMLVGAAISKHVGKAMSKSIFSMFGITSLEFNISFIWIALTIVGIFAVALVASGVSGLKVRMLRPVEMITED